MLFNSYQEIMPLRRMGNFFKYVRVDVFREDDHTLVGEDDPLYQLVNRPGFWHEMWQHWANYKTIFLIKTYDGLNSSSKIPKSLTFVQPYEYTLHINFETDQLYGATLDLPDTFLPADQFVYMYEYTPYHPFHSSWSTVINKTLAHRIQSFGGYNIPDKDLWSALYDIPRELFSEPEWIESNVLWQALRHLMVKRILPTVDMLCTQLDRGLWTKGLQPAYYLRPQTTQWEDLNLVTIWKEAVI